MTPRLLATLLLACATRTASALAVQASPSRTTAGSASPLLSEATLAELQRSEFVELPNFASPEQVRALVDDIALLRSSPGTGRSASAQRGSVEWYELMPTPPSVAARGDGRGVLLEMVAGLQLELEQHLRVELSAEHTELKYAFYPTGGFYQRHVDAMNVGKVAREWSFILYLNERWKPSDGGHLRVFDAGSGVAGSGTLLADFTSGHSPLLSGAGHVDIAPRAGTLALFRSDTVPHEVRHTSAKRMCVIGWLHRELSDAEAPVEPDEGEMSELALALKRHYEGKGERIKGFQSVDRAVS